MSRVLHCFLSPRSCEYVDGAIKSAEQVWQKKLHKVEQLQLPQHKMQGALLLYVVVREGSEKNRHLKETKIRTSQKAKNEEDIFGWIGTFHPQAAFQRR